MMNSKPDQSTDQYEQAPAERAISAGEILIGTLAGINDEGRPLVDFAGDDSDGPLPAMTLVSVTPRDKGRQVALQFVEGDPGRPVVMGLVHSPLQDLIANFEMMAADRSHEPEGDDAAGEAVDSPSTDAYVDGERVVLEGREEIVLKCGDASITLTRAGKILIRGKYLLNRSAGVNRIMGGSVQVN